MGGSHCSRQVSPATSTDPGTGGSPRAAEGRELSSWALLAEQSTLVRQPVMGTLVPSGGLHSDVPPHLHAPIPQQGTVPAWGQRDGCFTAGFKDHGEQQKWSGGFSKRGNAGAARWPGETDQCQHGTAARPVKEGVGLAARSGGRGGCVQEIRELPSAAAP